MQNLYRVCVVMAIALLTLTSWMATPTLANVEQTQSSQTAQQKPDQSQQQAQFPQQKPYEQTSQTAKQSNLEPQPKQSQPPASLGQKMKQWVNSLKS
jgi:hypothetical protein